MRPPRATSPFDVLGLPAAAELTDDDIRAAWRRVATATHPDRADGGDPARFAEAAAAYTALRTRFARTETLADLAGHGTRRSPGLGSALVQHASLPFMRRGRLAALRLWSRVLRGRPVRLVARAAAAAAVCGVTFSAAGTRPATPALVAGVLTWLILTARQDLEGR